MKATKDLVGPYLFLPSEISGGESKVKTFVGSIIGSEHYRQHFRDTDESRRAGELAKNQKPRNGSTYQDRRGMPVTMDRIPRT